MAVRRGLLLELVLVAAAVAVGAAAAAVDRDEPRYRVHAHASDLAAVEAATSDYRRVYGDAPNGEISLEAFVSEAGLATLRAMARHGVAVVETAQPLRSKLGGGKDAKAPQLRQQRVLPEGYSTLDEINAYFSSVQAAYPDLALVLDSRDYAPGLTFENRPLPLLKLAFNVSAAPVDKPTILVNALHHAREIVTPHLTLDTLDRLTRGYANDSAIRAIVDNNVLVFAPVWNPDGYEYVWNVNNMWRKNRKPSGGNAVGIDQNRNYDVGWDGDCPGSSTPSSDTYRGPSPASEEETQTMKTLTAAFNFAKMIDFHSSGREVVYGFQCEPIPAFLDSYITAEGEALAVYANYDARPPAADAQHQVWTIAKATTYAFLVETETEFQPSFERAQSEAERVWPLTRAFLERTIPLTGHITGRGGAPVAAEIRVTSLTDLFVYNSDRDFGRYSLFLPDGRMGLRAPTINLLGQYTLVVSAPGYTTQSVPATVTNSAPSVLDITLA